MGGAVRSHSCLNSGPLFSLAQASLDRSVKLWDARNLGPDTGSGMKPVAEMEHFRSVNSAHFSPGGEWMVTVAQDNKLRLYRDLALGSGKVRKVKLLCFAVHYTVRCSLYFV